MTMYGTINSHTAVLARTKGIPAVIGLGESLKEEYDGKTIIIDGYEGKIYIEPVSYTHLDVYKRQVRIWSNTKTIFTVNGLRMRRLQQKLRLEHLSQVSELCPV